MATPSARGKRRQAFFDARYLRMASRNIGSTISGQEYEWDITGGQSVGDWESHFALELKVKRHPVQKCIRDYVEYSINSRRSLYNLCPLGSHRINEIVGEQMFVLDDQYAFAGQPLCHCRAPYSH
jgi:hypothetical protein